MYKKPDKYVQAVANLYEEEKETKGVNKNKRWIKKKKKKTN